MAVSYATLKPIEGDGVKKLMHALSTSKVRKEAIDKVCIKKTQRKSFNSK